MTPQVLLDWSVAILVAALAVLAVFVVAKIVYEEGFR